jgi:hypothetical protein
MIAVVKGLLIFSYIAAVSAFGLSSRPISSRPSAYSNAAPVIDRTSMKTGARSMTMMPIGVPKVAYRMPGSRGGEWVDIYQRLTRERIIFMASEIDDELANQIIGVLLVRKLQRYKSITFAPNGPISQYLSDFYGFPFVFLHEK